MAPKFPGTGVDMPTPPREKAHSQSEVTPIHETIMARIRSELGAEVERFDTIEAVQKSEAERLSKVETAVTEIKDEQRAGNRRIALAVAAIGLAGMLITGLLAYWGQIQAIKAGASQANVGASQAVQNATPSTEGSFNAGAKAERQKMVEEIRAMLQANPAPIVKSPDRVAPTRQTR